MLSRFLFRHRISSAFPFHPGTRGKSYSFSLWSTSPGLSFVCSVPLSVCCVSHVASGLSSVRWFLSPSSHRVLHFGDYIFHLYKSSLTHSKTCLLSFNLFFLSNVFQFLLFHCTYFTFCTELFQYLWVHSSESVVLLFSVACCWWWLISFVFNEFWIMKLWFLKCYLWKFFVAWV